jgi:hypothetical protein
VASPIPVASSATSAPSTADAANEGGDDAELRTYLAEMRALGDERATGKRASTAPSAPATTDAELTEHLDAMRRIGDERAHGTRADHHATSTPSTPDAELTEHLDAMKRIGDQRLANQKRSQKAG